MIRIAGGGPAGLLAAREIARKGMDVTVYEEHGEIGKPVQCTGLVSRSGLDALDVDYADSVLNEIGQARFVSPSGKEFYLRKRKGYALVIDRTEFDNEIANEATSEGASIELGRRLLDEESITIAADGAASYFARKHGINRNYVVAYQIENRMKVDVDTVEIHFGSFAPGFFAWLVPVDENRVRMGLGYRPDVASRVHDAYNPKTALRFFAKIRGYPWVPISEQGGLIPLFDNSPSVFDNLALVGDAAAQVKASTGGGIAIGGQCAMILGKIVGEGGSLDEYESVWREKFGRELRVHLAVHKFYSKLGDAEFEELFDAVDDEILRIIEKNAEMESISGLGPVVMSYVSKHPIKAMRLAKYLKYVDGDVTSMFKFK